MKLLLLSTDHYMLDPQSTVFQRTLEYAKHCETLTVIVSGTGKPREYAEGNLRVVAPGGMTKVMNFFRMLYMARLVGGTVVTAQDPFYMGLIGALSHVRPFQIQMHTTHFGLIGYALAFVTLRFATCVRVVSEDVRRRIAPLTRAPISVLPIFVDAEKLLVPQGRPSEYGTHPVIMTASRLTPEKHVATVINALVRVPNAHLYIVGDGPLRNSLESRVRNLGLQERVHFLGWKHDVTAYYQHADCFVQMSAFEGYGLSLMGAVIAGVPAISTNVGIATELAPEIVTITPNDEYRLSESIQNVLSHKSREHGRGAREALVRSLLTRAEYSKHYMQLLITCGTSTS